MTRIWNSFGIAIVLGVAIFADPAGASAQQNLPRIALKGGESADLRNFFFITNCQSILNGPTQVEVLEGPDEVTLAIRDEMVLPRAQNCPKPVPGGVVVATAEGVTERKDAKLTFRLKFKTKLGDRQTSNTYIISLFPGPTSEGVFAPSTPSMNSTPSGSSTH
jgi:hypothetical protein